MFERVWQFFASLCDLRGHRPRNPSAPEELPEKGQDGRTPFAPRCLKDAVEERLFAHRRDLLTRLDLVFMDTTSLYFEGAGGQTLGRHGYSKDHRPDLRQVILAALIDGDGRPVPGLRPGDVAGRHRRCDDSDPGDRPAAPALRHRAGVCVVADRGMISADGAGERPQAHAVFGLVMGLTGATRRIIRRCCCPWYYSCVAYSLTRPNKTRRSWYLMRYQNRTSSFAIDTSKVNGALMAACPGRWRAPEEAWTTSRS